MSLPTISGVGRLTQDVELRFSQGGTAVATINLAFNARRFDKDRQEWVDGDVFFVRGTAFNQLAENSAETLKRGMEVHVVGRLKTDQWEDKKTGDKRSAVSLLVDAIGPNLAYATATVQRNERDGGGGRNAGSGRSGGRGYDEGQAALPPGSGPVDDEPPF